MMRIIEGKRYNTETATRVANLGSTLSRSDFNWHDTSLYVTKSGQWFLAGEGGPASMWRHRAGNMWGYGEGIRPISKAEALEELEAVNDIDSINEYFADSVQDA